MKVLVTGGAGFIGAHLCASLVLSGYDVVCLDNMSTSRVENLSHLLGKPGFRLVTADVEDSHSLEFLAQDVLQGTAQVYHLACPASPVHYQKDPVRTMKTAFIGTMNVFELALSLKARVLITSTSEVYGDPTTSPQPESYPGRVNTLGPRACYDEGKRAAESLAYSYAVSRGLDVRIARLFNTYGPGMGIGDGRLIPNFVSRAIQGLPLQVYGDGSQTRSLCYVDDMVDGLRRLMASGRVQAVEAVNLGNPDERTVVSIAEDIAAKFSPTPPVHFLPPLVDDPRQRCPDISKAADLLGWGPTVSYESGIALTVGWFQSRLRA